jgi:hypothetical protein
VADSTAVRKVEELREELAARGIVFAVARRKHSAARLFESSWVDAQRELTQRYNYPTLKSAVNAFDRRGDRAAETATGQPTGQGAGA